MTAFALELARFVGRFEIANLPQEVVEKARACLLNAYGIALDCHDTPYAPVARAAALAMDGERKDGATLLGDGRRTSVGGACLANSALFHGRAQEDSCGAAHFGTILVPLLTAMIEAGHGPVARLIPALAAGYEAGGALEKTYAGATTPGGFRSSAIYGTIAAAAAAARMLNLDEARFAAALSNAVSFSGGVLQSFADGTDEWRYQVGIVARNGLVAAELARAGSVSAPHAFEGKSGFVRAFARSDADMSAVTKDFGRDWAILRTAFKPYPVCAFNQTPVIAALALREQIGERRIARARVRMNPYEMGYAGMDSTGPFHSISGTLMSIPFCIAATLVRGAPSMQLMTTYDDKAVNALVPHIALAPDSAVPTLCAVIEVETDDGARFVQDQKMGAQDYAYGRAEVLAMIRRIGDEQNVPQRAFDLIEYFIDQLPAGDIGAVVDAFALLSGAHAHNARLSA